MQGDEVVHVEEAAVVDLPRRLAPVHQAVDLGIEQPGESLPSIGTRAEDLGGGLERPDRRPDPRPHASGARAPRRHRRAAPRPRRRDRVVRRGSRRRPIDHLGQGAAAGVLGAEPVPAARQRSAAARWAVSTGPGGKRARSSGRAAPPGRRTSAISPRSSAWRTRVSQDRQEHPAAEARLRGAPLDVEPARVAGGRAMSEDVLPGGVLVRGRHVIGHDVEHEPHPLLHQRLVQRGQIGLGADLRVEHGRDRPRRSRGCCPAASAGAASNGDG